MVAIRRDQSLKLFDNGSDASATLTVRDGLRPIPFPYNRNARDDVRAT
jgi:hypothetical protein